MAVEMYAHFGGRVSAVPPQPAASSASGSSAVAAQPRILVMGRGLSPFLEISQLLVPQNQLACVVDYRDCESEMNPTSPAIVARRSTGISQPSFDTVFGRRPAPQHCPCFSDERHDHTSPESLGRVAHSGLVTGSGVGGACVLGIRVSSSGVATAVTKGQPNRAKKTPEGLCAPGRF